MKTKQLLTILILLFTSIPAFSQGQLKDVFKIQYDQNGDRINKYYCCTIMLKTADTAKTELKSNNYTIYFSPNPTSGIIKLKLTLEGVSSQIANEFYYTVTDLSGDIIWKFQNKSLENQIDLSNQPEGVYFLKINQEVSKFTKY